MTAGLCRSHGRRKWAQQHLQERTANATAREYTSTERWEPVIKERRISSPSEYIPARSTNILTSWLLGHGRHKRVEILQGGEAATKLSTCAGEQWVVLNNLRATAPTCPHMSANAVMQRTPPRMRVALAAAVLELNLTRRACKQRRPIQKFRRLVLDHVHFSGPRGRPHFLHNVASNARETSVTLANGPERHGDGHSANGSSPLQQRENHDDAFTWHFEVATGTLGS